LKLLCNFFSTALARVAARSKAFLIDAYDPIVFCADSMIAMKRADSLSVENLASKAGALPENDIYVLGRGT